MRLTKVVEIFAVPEVPRPLHRTGTLAKLVHHLDTVVGPGLVRGPQGLQLRRDDLRGVIIEKDSSVSPGERAHDGRESAGPSLTSSGAIAGEGRTSESGTFCGLRSKFGGKQRRARRRGPIKASIPPRCWATSARARTPRILVRRNEPCPPGQLAFSLRNGSSSEDRHACAGLRILLDRS